MGDVALLDLVRHFVARGENLGSLHPALAVLRVVNYRTDSDAFATVIRGRCEFNGFLSIDASNGLSVKAGVDEAAPAFDPAQRAPVFDIRETTVEFELVAARTGSSVIAAGVQSIGAPASFAPTQAVLDALAQPAPGVPPSDYPATDFSLELMLNAPRLRPPFLHPAKLNDVGTLSPDPTKAEVALTLPKLRFRISQAAPGLRVELVSAGAAGLDDPGDIGVAELITMDPPYAFIGRQTDRVIGIGLRSATLDLSGESTPAAIREKTGVGDDWTGLYLPDARIFVAPTEDRGLAFDVGAKELLIGVNESAGIWGDFEAVLVNQGSGELIVGARFADPSGHLYGIHKFEPLKARARIPAKTQLLVDVSGGRTPYTIEAKVGAAPKTSGRVFVVDFGASNTMTIEVTATAQGGTTKTLTITAERLAAIDRLDTPGPQPATTSDLEVGPPTGDLTIVVVTRHTDDVVLATDPRDDTLLWAVDGGAPGAASATITVPVAVGASHIVTARRPASSVPSAQPFYFSFDEPAVSTPTPDVWTTKAAAQPVPVSRVPGGQDSMAANHALLTALPDKAKISITGQASKEKAGLNYNFQLALRRAASVQRAIQRAYPAKRFDITAYPLASTPPAAWDAATGWSSHVTDRNQYWRVDVSFPIPVASPERTGTISIARPTVPTHVEKPPQDPQPERPASPDWFRAASVKVRVIASEIIAVELTLEVDFETFAEERLRNTGQLPAGSQSPTGKALVNGTAVGPGNPADGITKFRVLVQSDPATGKITTLIAAGADPADKDGLYLFGWMPGDPGAPTLQHPASSKDFPRTLLGAYLTFWPLLAEFPPVEAGEALADGEATTGDIVNASIAGAALVLPAVIAAVPWFQVERVVLYGAEFEGAWRSVDGVVGFDGRLLFDVEVDWSANFLGLIEISTQAPLKVRYKAIGLRFGNTEDDGSQGFMLRPIFDSGRGFTIDLASGGSIKLIDPLGQILKILGARVSKQNPLSFEIEIGLGIDLGVVSIERAGLRVVFGEPPSVELTSLGASVDIPGALVGSGYIKIGKTTDSQGNEISVIGGQLDLTLRTISLRVSAALAIATIPEEAGGPATGVYVGMDIILPVGIPLGSSGLGIFGFRGIFGMHYQRNPAIGASSNIPSLAWLQAAGGRPNLLANGGVELWTPEIDKWAFGIGILIGTMEGGYILNLDGTFLLELPGPRVIIMLNARIVSPPPSMDGMGMSGGILAVIEISPEHFLIGLIVEWSIEDLIRIVIPIEAVFPFGANASKWHIYLGARPGLGQPVSVDVLGIVRGTGYLMFKGDGLPAFPVHKATLPEIKGFAIGLGVGASFTWGDVDAGLYLKVGGGMDAVIGFDPFILAGTIWVVGELRIFIVSIGADAQLTAIVAEQPDGSFDFSAHGQACGHVDFFFFEVSGCVEIDINSDPPAAKMPALVEKLSLKSRSPALLQGTGVDRGIDTSLGEAVRGAMPALNDPNLPIVPIDAVPVISMNVPPVVPAGLTISGLPAASISPAGGLLGAPDVGYAERGGERYRYDLSSILVERIDPATGNPVTPAVSGTTAPVTWWRQSSANEPAPVAQLALFTWEPSPATKAVEKTDHLVEDLVNRWGTVCSVSAEAAEVLWTFRFEDLGPSITGWDLEGIAWPDAAGTVRTAPPATDLRVTERWRSGDLQLDGMRGVIPAVVVAAAVPCRRKPTRPDFDEVGPAVVIGGRGPIRADSPSGAFLPDHGDAFGHLVRNDDQKPARVTSRLLDKVTVASLTEEHLRNAVVGSTTSALRDVITRSSAGDAVSRTAQAAALGALRPSDDQTGRATKPSCAAKVLQAPMLDDGSPISIGDQRRAEEVAKRLDELKVTHGELDDVVVMHTSGFASADVLLLCHRKREDDWPVVRVVGKDDSTLDRIQLDGSFIISPAGVPTRWDDPAGPWANDVDDVLAYATTTGLLALLVHLDEYPDAVTVEVGSRHDDSRRDKQLTPAYWLAAFSTVSWAEITRRDWDQTQQDSDKSVLTKLLGPTPTDDVLLIPDSLYRITVNSYGTRKGDGATRGSSVAPTADSFWFRTDRIADGPVPATGGGPAEPVAAANAPALHFASTPPLPVRLEPWLLVTLPAEGERNVFTDQNVKIVFNTADVERIFKAYGKQLQVRVEASSGRHPKETGDGLALPLLLTADLLHPVAATVLSPYEDALLDAAAIISRDAEFCIDIDETRTRHIEIDIPIHLDRATDYILDVEVVPDGAAAGTRGPRVFRRQFSTGMFGSFGELAGSLAGARVVGRGARTGAVAGIVSALAGHAPAGSEFDDAWIAAGFDPLQTASVPRITVLWEQPDASLPPVPTGLLVEASAPLTRGRPYPRAVTDTTGPVPADRWVLEDRTWLDLVDASAAGVVQSIIHSPGADRYLVLLQPGARGRLVELDLVDAAFPDLPFLNQTEHRRAVVWVALDRAPWEE